MECKASIGSPVYQSIRRNLLQKLRTDFVANEGRIYVVQSLSSEAGRIVAVWCTRSHRRRRDMVPCQLVSRPSKRQLSACSVSRTTVVVVNGDLNVGVGT